MKICNKFALTNSSQLPATLMEVTELFPGNKDKIIFNSFRILYQRKVSSLLFAAIATWPDIAFAVSRLSRFNQRPGKQHHEAANRVFHYLFRTQDYFFFFFFNSIKATPSASTADMQTGTIL